MVGTNLVLVLGETQKGNVRLDQIIFTLGHLRHVVGSVGRIPCCTEDICIATGNSPSLLTKLVVALESDLNINSGGLGVEGDGYVIFTVFVNFNLIVVSRLTASGTTIGLIPSVVGTNLETIRCVLLQREISS